MKTTSTKQMLILIAARPGVIRNSLLSYLRAIEGVQTVVLADDAAKAMLAIREFKPSLVVLDTHMAEDEVMDLLQRMRTEQPDAKSIVLVESVRQQELCISNGATRAVLKGLLADQLNQAVMSQIATI